MPMTKLAAWTIFKEVTEGGVEGTQAVAALVGDEADEYHAHVEQFNLELAQAIIEVQAEASALLSASPMAEFLKTQPAHRYTAQDYKALVSIFEGSKYETLHLTGFFRIQNTELLLELVKPAS